MYLTRKWNEIMGPKDERLETEENRTAKVGAFILLAGSLISMYYAIMLDQVANTTEHPLLTELGAEVIPVYALLTATILIAGAVSIGMQIRAGMFSSYKRVAEVDTIPWDYVTLVAVVCGALLGVLTCVMRIVAEIQIVGIAHVAWGGDIAMGVVYFIMGFGLGFLFMAATIHDAIKRRHQLEAELEG